MSSKKTYTFPITFDLENRVHVRAKENLECLSRETGLNKKQALLMVLGMLDISKFVDSMLGVFGNFLTTEKTTSVIPQSDIYQKKQEIFTPQPFTPQPEMRQIQKIQEKPDRAIIPQAVPDVLPELENHTSTTIQEPEQEIQNLQQDFFRKKKTDEKQQSLDRQKVSDEEEPDSIQTGEHDWETEKEIPSDMEELSQELEDTILQLFS